MQLTDNAGATDEHRSLNYLAMRYPAIYAKAVEQFGLDFRLQGVEVRQSSLSGTRKIVDVIFAQSEYRLYGQILCTCRCHGGVLGDKIVTILRPLKREQHSYASKPTRFDMNISKFTAEASVYTSKARYQSVTHTANNGDVRPAFHDIATERPTSSGYHFFPAPPDRSFAHRCLPVANCRCQTFTDFETGIDARLCYCLPGTLCF
jgi:PatG C-terminal